MNPDNQLQQRGCRICLQLTHHDLRCRFATGLDSPVLDSERESGEPEVPDVLYRHVMKHGLVVVNSDRKSPEDIEYRRVKTCEWKAGRNKGDWDSECNQGWWFEDGDPEDHGWKHCPFCGGQLLVEIPNEQR